MPQPSTQHGTNKGWGPPPPPLWLPSPKEQDAAPLGPQPCGSGPHTGASQGLAPAATQDPLPSRWVPKAEAIEGSLATLLHRAGSAVPVPVPTPIAALPCTSPQHRPVAGSHPRSRGCRYHHPFPPKNSPPCQGAHSFAASTPKKLCSGPDHNPPPRSPPRSARTWLGGCRHRGLMAHAGTGLCRW